MEAGIFSRQKSDAKMGYASIAPDGRGVSRSGLKRSFTCDHGQFYIWVTMDLEAEKAAEAMAEQLGPIFDRFKEAIDIKVDRLKDEFENHKMMKKADEG